MGLPSQLRMTRSGEYAAVRAKGIARSGRLMTVAFLKDDSIVPLRFGFTLTKRLGNAVKRNLLRRRLREISRLSFPLMTGAGRVVTIPRRDAVGAPFEEIRNEWHVLVRKLKLLPPAVPGSSTSDQPSEAPSPKPA